MQVSEEERSPVCEPVLPLCRLGSFFAGSSSILNSNWHMTVEGRSSVVLNIMHDFKSHFLSLLH